MNGEQVLDLIDTLARSQGFYGRLGRSLRENYPDRDELIAKLGEAFADCEDDLDVIMAIEG